MLACSISASAATFTAATASFADVSTALALSSAGDTVIIPAGTVGWWQRLTITGITLQGAGTNLTIIRDETPIAGDQTLLAITTTPNFETRVTGIQFQAGVTNNITNNANNFSREILIGGTGNNWRIDNCQFRLLSGKTIELGGDAHGLIDHCNFDTYNRIAFEIYGAGYGDAAWNNPITLGSSNTTYVEDNYFKDENSFGWIDVSGGGSIAVRNNVFSGYFVNTHGAETAQRYRSSRYIEVYRNIFTYATNSDFQNFYAMCDVRGGSAVIWSNVAYGYYAVGSLNYYRSTDNDPGFTPWYGATGLTNWDNNGAEVLSGIATSAGTTLTVLTATWTTDQWKGCTVFNYASNKLGMVTGNTANTMTFMGSRASAQQIGFKIGDTFSVHNIYPMLDAPGVGQGDLLSGDNPSPVNLHQTSQIIYGWGNVRYQNATQNTPPTFAGTNGASTSYPNIVAGRDYTNSLFVGYVPYAYPHPLTTNQITVVTYYPFTGILSH